MKCHDREGLWRKEMEIKAACVGDYFHTLHSKCAFLLPFLFSKPPSIREGSRLHIMRYRSISNPVNMSLEVFLHQLLNIHHMFCSFTLTALSLYAEILNQQSYSVDASVALLTTLPIYLCSPFCHFLFISRKIFWWLGWLEEIKSW